METGEIEWERKKKDNLEKKEKREIKFWLRRKRKRKKKTKEWNGKKEDRTKMLKKKEIKKKKTE